MLFESHASPRRLPGRGAAWSAAVHASLAVLAVLVVRHAATPSEPPTHVPALVWVPATLTSAPAGGGQGGGERRPGPLRRAQAPGRDVVTVTPPPPEQVSPPLATTPPPLEQTLALSATPMAAGLTSLVGVIDADSPTTGTQGTEDGPGVDGGGDAGVGRGRDGRGIGPGSGGETGGEGPPGNGVSWPRLIRGVRPSYTNDAMRAGVTGTVSLSCVVDRDGTVRDCRLTRSLDAQHGLDQEAMRAATRWQFEPARRQNDPVAVRVPIEMTFTLR